MRIALSLLLLVAPLLRVMGAAPVATNIANFPSVSVAYTNYLAEGIVTNGLTLGGVRRTTWPAAIFNSISDMVASAATATNTAYYVRSYYGTNDTVGAAWGGGWFTLDTTSTAATNYGTVFAANGGGRWLRVLPAPDIYYMEWFGVASSVRADNGGSSFVDCTLQIQNCVDTTPNRSVIYVPRMVLATSGLVISNRIGLTITADSLTHGYRNGFEAPAFTYCGVATNGPVVAIYDSAYITWSGLLVDTEYPSSTPTSHANIAMAVDEPGPHITTDIQILNSTFQCRSTNANWIGLDISRASGNNVENSLVDNCNFNGGFQGGTWALNGANGTAIVFSGSDNTFNWVFRRTRWSNCNIGVVMSGGKASFDDCGGDRALIDFHLIRWTGPIEINNLRSEGAKQAVVMQAAQGGVHVTHSTWADGEDPGAVPLFYVETLGVGGIPQLSVDHCNFGGITNRLVFGVTNTVASSFLYCSQNSYGTIPLANIRYSQFSTWAAIDDYTGATQLALNASDATLNNLTASRVVVADSAKKLTSSATTGLITGTGAAGSFADWTNTAGIFTTGTAKFLGENGTMQLISSGSGSTNISDSGYIAVARNLTVSTNFLVGSFLHGASGGSYGQIDANGASNGLWPFTGTGNPGGIAFRPNVTSTDDGLAFGAERQIVWTTGAGNAYNQTIDTRLGRDAAAVLRVYDGTTGTGSVRVASVLFGTNVLSYTGTNLTWNGTAITVP